MKFDLETDNKIETYKNLLIRKDSLKKERELVWLAYVREFGNLIEETLKVKLECISLKKKIAYCQARQNRNEAIIASDMEYEIEAELAEYFEELEQIQIIKDSKGIPVSDYEFLKIKKLYRKIATMIHPDLHPELFEKVEIAELWNKAKNAYLTNDYEQLKEAEFLIVEAIKKYSETQDEIVIDDVEKKIEAVRKEIETIVSTDPYKYKFILEDKELLTEEQTHIREEIEQYQKYLEELYEIFLQYTITEIIN